MKSRVLNLASVLKMQRPLSTEYRNPAAVRMFHAGFKMSERRWMAVRLRSKSGPGARVSACGNPVFTLEQ
jgi:hypothetical protein